MTLARHPATKLEMNKIFLGEASLTRAKNFGNTRDFFCKEKVRGAPQTL